MGKTQDHTDCLKPYKFEEFNQICSADEKFELKSDEKVILNFDTQKLPQTINLLEYIEKSEKVQTTVQVL